MQIDWSHADIILCNNVTWGQALLGQVVELAASLKENSRFISFAKLPESSHMQLKYCLSVQMSWGSQPCFFYLITSGAENQ